MKIMQQEFNNNYIFLTRIITKDESYGKEAGF